MGRDKARLHLGGERLVDRVVRRLAAVCDEVLVADRGRALVAGRASVVDAPGAGPGAGILGAALERPGRPLLVLACDLPAVTEELLGALLTRSRDLCLPRWRRGIEPLCALYGPRALAVLERRMAEGHRALRGLCAERGLDIEWLEGSQLEDIGDPEALFANLNSPSDLGAWLE